jgi:hypothetical protein
LRWTDKLKFMMVGSLPGKSAAPIFNGRRLQLRRLAHKIVAELLGLVASVVHAEAAADGRGAVGENIVGKTDARSPIRPAVGYHARRIILIDGSQHHPVIERTHARSDGTDGGAGINGARYRVDAHSLAADYHRANQLHRLGGIVGAGHEAVHQVVPVVVIDPGRKLRQKADVGLADGKIAAVEPDIPAESGLDVINRVPGMGTLEIGAPADIALLAIEDGNFQLIDSQKNVVNAAERIVSRLTVCRGRRVTTPL